MSATSTPQVVGSAQPSEKVRKLTAMDGVGVTAVPLRAIADSGSVPGIFQGIVHEQAADIILLGQSRDDLGSQRPVAGWKIDKIGAAIGRDDDHGVRGIASDQAVAPHGIGVRGHLCAFRIGIVEGQAQRVGNVDGHEAGRQQAGGHVLVGLRRGPTRRALLRDRRKAVVRGDDHIGHRHRALAALSAASNLARLSSAFLIAASEVGPLMPGISRPRLSPWLCCVPSGSRDQNTTTKRLAAVP